jgi:nitric oxide synthase-interacting protein
MTELREVFSTGTCVSRKVAAFNLQQKQDQGEELEKRTLERERQLDAFDHQNNSAVPHQQGTQLADGRHAFHGANSVRVTAYEEEALRTMKAFWLPSATPEAQERVQAPLMDTCCPQGNEKLRLKDLFPITFTDVPHQEKEIDMHAVKYLCPSCSVTFTNTQTLVAVSSCGHVFCKKCAEQFVAQDKSCLACSKVCKSKNLVVLEKGGTGFSGHDENLEATTFKHVGSGTGMGLSRPTTQL